MAKKKISDIYTLTNFTIDEIANLYDVHELEMLLYLEPDILEVDLMLEGLEEYLVIQEKYLHCCVVRDERIRRMNRQVYKRPLFR